MRQIASLGVIVLTAAALATPVVAPAADASAPPVAVSHTAASRVEAIRLERSAKGVQPGLRGLRVTAFVHGSGSVRFTITGKHYEKTKSVRIDDGRAVLKVPALGTGKYRVRAGYGGRVGATGFRVYDSALTLNATSFTFSASAAVTGYAPLSGDVRFKSRPASHGYVDFYLNGDLVRGSRSPSFLGYVAVAPDGTFNAGTGFGSKITRDDLGLSAGNLGAFAPGTYTLRAYYTDDATYQDYVSSNVITVVVTP